MKEMNMDRIEEWNELDEEGSGWNDGIVVEWK